jgi:hypothetical protein
MHILMVERIMKTLDGEPVLFHPSCFYLDGYQARWIQLKDLPRENVAFSVAVSWKAMRMDVCIASNVPSATEPYSITLENPCSNKEYLKSHLQKCIRRSNVYKTIKTAYHHIDTNLQDFLRRLSIIAVEDALPIDGFSTLVWFMAANSKGYQLSEEQLHWCLGYAADLARCKFRERASSEETAPCIKSMRLKRLPPPGQALVYSILFRHAYGGMEDDGRMLLGMAGLWAARYHTCSRYVENLQRRTNLITPPSEALQKEEWYLAAIDFHCCPHILQAMTERHDEYSEEQIRMAIWYCSSSITDKTDLSGSKPHVEPGCEEIWNEIKKDVVFYARRMLERA